MLKRNRTLRTAKDSFQHSFQQKPFVKFFNRRDIITITNIFCLVSQASKAQLILTLVGNKFTSFCFHTKTNQNSPSVTDKMLVY